MRPMAPERSPWPPDFSFVMATRAKAGGSMKPSSSSSAAAGAPRSRGKKRPRSRAPLPSRPLASKAKPVRPASVGSAIAEAVIVSKAMAAFRIGAPIGTVRSRASTIFKGVENALRRVGLLQHLGAERRKGVVDRVADGGRGADGSGLAGALGAERRAGDRRLHVRDDDVGHLERHRHQVVGERPVQELARFVIQALFIERGADT